MSTTDKQSETLVERWSSICFYVLSPFNFYFGKLVADFCKLLKASFVFPVFYLDFFLNVNIIRLNLKCTL